MQDDIKPSILNLVIAHIFKEFAHWEQGIGIYPLHRSGITVPIGWKIDIWSRAAGVLINNKWYKWTAAGQPFQPVYSADPQFLDVIIKSINDAFVRTGADVSWGREYPND